MEKGTQYTQAVQSHRHPLLPHQPLTETGGGMKKRVVIQVFPLSILPTGFVHAAGSHRTQGYWRDSDRDTDPGDGLRGTNQMRVGRQGTGARRLPREEKPMTRRITRFFLYMLLVTSIVLSGCGGGGNSGGSGTVVGTAYATKITGQIGSQTIDDNVEIPQDAALTLDNTIIKGNVFVRRGATLNANGARIIGNVQAYDAYLVDLRGSAYVDGDVQGKATRTVSVRDGTRVGGNVQIEEAIAPADVDALFVDNATVGGDVQAQKSSGRLRVKASQIGGNLQFFENRTGLYEITDNRVDGDIQFFKNQGDGTITGNSTGQDLQSKENNPPPTIQGNSVGGDLEI